MSSIIKSCKDSEIQRDYMMVERINRQYHTTAYESSIKFTGEYWTLSPECARRREK
jgi:hypothetical protein